jgi:hypothetical protein
VIAALLLRFGIPQWAAGLAAVVALALGLFGGLAWHDHVVFERGVAQERAHRDGLDAAATAKAEAERARLNARLALAQGQLDAALAAVEKLKSERDHEQAVSLDRQQRLLAGVERERVLIRVTTGAGTPGTAGPAQGAGAAPVDPGRAVGASLDGRVASDLEWLRQTRSDALAGLRACVASYDAVKAAADAQ